MTASRSLINGEQQLKLAVQRKGRLTDSTLTMLRQVGLRFESYGQRLFSKARNYPLSILYGRDDDIPDYVGLGTVDLGIVGRNLVHEQGIEVEELLPLGFGYCQLVVAVPRESHYKSPEQLLNAKLATTYPASARRYFESLGGSPEIIEISGSVEVAPALGLADGIVELTATGSALRLNDLRPIHTVLESEAVLIANKASLEDPAKRESIDRLLMRLKAVQTAAQYTYVMMNAPEAALPYIRSILPGQKAPTVVPLADEGWVAVHSAIEEEVFWEKIEQLRDAGARDIIVSPIEKFVR